MSCLFLHLQEAPSPSPSPTSSSTTDPDEMKEKSDDIQLKKKMVGKAGWSLCCINTTIPGLHIRVPICVITTTRLSLQSFLRTLGQQRYEYYDYPRQQRIEDQEKVEQQEAD